MNNIDWGKVITPEMQTAARAREARVWRDGCIASTMWIVERHRGQVQLDGETSITNEQYIELLKFHQTLRDWPTHPEWPDIDEPVAPAWLETIQKSPEI